MRKMRRSELAAASYNPRQIDEAAKKKLRASLKRIGLVQPIIVNTRTGRVVGGHQRLDIMDSLEHGHDYEIDVAAIDVDEKSEKEINVMLNNELAMGTFDIDKLDSLFKNDGVDFAACGFEPFELEVLLPSFEAAMTPALAETTNEVKTVLADMDATKKAAADKAKALKKQIAARGDQKQPEFSDSELFVVLVFPNREMSDRFLETLKMPVDEKYISGETVLGIIRGAAAAPLSQESNK